MSDLGIKNTELEFGNNIVIFEISTLDFVWLKSFTEKKYLNLEPKMPDLGIFGLEPENNISYLKSAPSTKMYNLGNIRALFGYFWDGIWKQCCHIWNLHPQIWLFAEFHVKTKMPKFWTDSAWFGYFCAGIWKWYCHIWNQHSPICLIAKFCVKIKMPRLWTKNAVLGVFLCKNFKKLLSYLKSVPSNLSNGNIFWKSKGDSIWE